MSSKNSSLFLLNLRLSHSLSFSCSHVIDYKGNNMIGRLLLLCANHYRAMCDCL